MVLDLAQQRTDDGLGRLLDAREVDVLPAKVKDSGEAQLKDGLIIAPNGSKIPTQRRNQRPGVSKASTEKLCRK